MDANELEHVADAVVELLADALAPFELRLTALEQFLVALEQRLETRDV